MIYNYMKIVKEHINESFVNNDNKLSSLRIGKIQLIKNWIDYFQEQVNRNFFTTINLVINDDLTINCNSNLIFPDHLGNLPNYIQFNKVYGLFNCDNCDLTTLKGCPKEVLGNYRCQNNKLTSLEYGPTYLKGFFECDGNSLTDHEVTEFKKTLKYYENN